MIIVSQDKDIIVNFDKVESVWIDDTVLLDEPDFDIVAGDITIGTYKTEERAKEVLQEIITTYNNFEYFKALTDKQKEEIIEYLFDVYEMPEK